MNFGNKRRLQSLSHFFKNNNNNTGALKRQLCAGCIAITCKDRDVIYDVNDSVGKSACCSCSALEDWNVVPAPM